MRNLTLQIVDTDTGEKLGEVEGIEEMDDVQIGDVAIDLATNVFEDLEEAGEDRPVKALEEEEEEEEDEE